MKLASFWILNKKQYPSHAMFFRYLISQMRMKTTITDTAVVSVCWNYMYGYVQEFECNMRIPETCLTGAVIQRPLINNVLNICVMILCIFS